LWPAARATRSTFVECGIRNTWRSAMDRSYGGYQPDAPAAPFCHIPTHRNPVLSVDRPKFDGTS
jgi:hypothetical protein